MVGLFLENGGGGGREGVARRGEIGEGGEGKGCYAAACWYGGGMGFGCVIWRLVV